MKVEITYTYEEQDIEAAVLAAQRSKYGEPPSGFVWRYHKPSYSQTAEVSAMPVESLKEKEEQ